MPFCSSWMNLNTERVWQMIEQLESEEPELLKLFENERKDYRKPERSSIVGFGYPFAQKYVHFFCYSAVSVCGKHHHWGTLWKNIEDGDRVCGECYETILFILEQRS